MFLTVLCLIWQETYKNYSIHEEKDVKFININFPCFQRETR